MRNVCVEWRCVRMVVWVLGFTPQLQNHHLTPLGWVTLPNHLSQLKKGGFAWLSKNPFLCSAKGFFDGVPMPLHSGNNPGNDPNPQVQAKRPHLTLPKRPFSAPELGFQKKGEPPDMARTSEFAISVGIQVYK